MPESTLEQSTVSTTPVPSAQPQPRRVRGGFWRDLSGALAIAMSVLAAVVLVFQLLAWLRGMPGPGLAMVAGHLVAAALMVLAQHVADRRSGWPAGLLVAGVAVVAGATLWLFWWA